jgi:hypothetical protein
LQALLPPFKASVTITGMCEKPYGGKCIVDAKGLGAQGLEQVARASSVPA